MERLQQEHYRLIQITDTAPVLSHPSTEPLAATLTEGAGGLAFSPSKCQSHHRSFRRVNQVGRMPTLSWLLGRLVTSHPPLQVSPRGPQWPRCPGQEGEPMCGGET